MNRWTTPDQWTPMLEWPTGEFYAVEDVQRERDEREALLAELRAENERLEILVKTLLRQEDKPSVLASAGIIQTPDFSAADEPHWDGKIIVDHNPKHPWQEASRFDEAYASGGRVLINGRAFRVVDRFYRAHNTTMEYTVAT